MGKRKLAGKALVIVESPAKAKTINKYLGDEYVVKASLGHVRDLPQKDFGIDVTNDFEPTYEIVKARAKVVNELKKLAAGAKEIFLATDLDREGEAIAWHLVEALNLPAGKVRRVIFNAITRSAIAEAFAHPHEIDHDRVNAQQARRILDRIVGYKLSPLLWKKIAKGLSAGRVQSVAVRLIVEREREIRAFIPEESWKLSAYLAGHADKTEIRRGNWHEFIRGGERSQRDIQTWLGRNGCLRAELVEVGGQPFAALNADQARTVAEALGFAVERVDRRPWAEYRHLNLEQAELVGALDPGRVSALTVSDLTTKRTSTKPPAPFTTAGMQQQASTVLRFAASRTMRVAQSLYEGIDLNGEGPVGLITYMRTDSTNLSKEALDAVRGFIKNRYGDAYLPAKPNMYGKRQARTQEAHEAIRPTDPALTPESIKKALTAEQYKLYDLIWKRFVASQMPAAQWDSTTVSIKCETTLGAARFAGSGRKLVFDGYLKVAGISSEDQLLPVLAQGQSVGLLDLDPKQQFTTPPPRFTEAALVKAMEAEGIGRPSTYAAIIDTIQSRGYVELEERKFVPTSLGELVTDKLVRHFPKIMDVKFTSYMEDELDKIEEAHLDWVRVLHEFYDPFRDLLSRAGDEMEMVRGQPSNHKCPVCESPMVYRWSKTGRFLACSGYPKCKGTLNVDRNGDPVLPQTSEHSCELCGKPMLVRQSKTGHFLGCSGYPECRNTIPCNEHGEPLKLVKEEDLKRRCDLCGEGELIVKRKGRKAFLGCNRYPECKNTTPLPDDVRLESKPAPPPEQAGVNCEKCGRPMVIRSGRRGKFVACSGFPRCRETMPLDKLEEAQAKAPREATHTASGSGEAAAPESESESSRPADALPAGYALTRTGRPVVEVLPEAGTLTCPQCGSTVEMKRGRFGPFFSCTNFPRCRFNCNLRGQAKKQAEELLPAPAKPKSIPTEITCDECGQPMVIREGRRGKFLGCSAYPRCKGTKELPAGFDVEKATASAQGT
ncbi:MAG: type I DNA topoisomerase [Phycisphaerae bacterium]|nr:type I DNA topoisomerase [Phycisphaerae bacterium]